MISKDLAQTLYQKEILLPKGIKSADENVM